MGPQNSHYVGSGDYEKDGFDDREISFNSLKPYCHVLDTDLTEITIPPNLELISSRKQL